MLTFLGGGCIGFMSGDLTTLVGKIFLIKQYINTLKIF
jgi:hypothetical protein